MSVFVKQNNFMCNFPNSDSWVILSPIEQRIKRKIEEAGTPLKDWNVNIYRGILTGCNDAFIISTEKRKEILDNCKTSEERRRTEELIRPKYFIINEEYGFLDRNKGKESFLEYFKKLMIERGSSQNWATAYMHFHNYTHGECRFCDLTVPYCQGFLDYLLSDACMHNGKRMMGTTANNNLTKLKCILAIAYEDGLLKENIAKKLVRAKAHGNKRQFLTKEELLQLSQTPCKSDVLRRAGLFSCLTGLRLSDCIRLQWENIVKLADGGWGMDIITKKTSTAAILPISEEALQLCGERGTGQVFKNLTNSTVALYLKPWIKSSGIEKHITFHCFRHTFATLQLAEGTDIYTVSKLLTHSNLATTQVYADVVDELKRDAAERISLKMPTKAESDQT
jgi:site-specific recombinase XerD